MHFIILNPFMTPIYLPNVIQKCMNDYLKDKTVFPTKTHSGDGLRAGVVVRLNLTQGIIFLFFFFALAL